MKTLLYWLDYDTLGSLDVECVLCLFAYGCYGCSMFLGLLGDVVFGYFSFDLSYLMG